MSNDETCDDADSTTTIFSTSSQGSALSLISRNNAELLKLKQEIETNIQDPRTGALDWRRRLVNNLLEQRQTAIRLLEDISKRPTPEPYEAPEAESIVQEEKTEPVAEEEVLKPEKTVQISSKEFFRRIRQRLSRKEFETFVLNMKELNTLREERVRRKYVSFMHPLTFSCWPKIYIDPGEWENVVATS